MLLYSVTSVLCKRFALLFLLLGIAIMSFRTVSQQSTVTGQVTSAGKPLPGVDVSIKGTDLGTVTNIKGEYRIQAKSTDTLVFYNLGYINQKVAVSGRTTINVTMKEKD